MTASRSSRPPRIPIPVTVSAGPDPFAVTLFLRGTGITNNSGTTQNFVTTADGAGDAGRISFSNGATAGTSTVFTNNGGVVAGAFGGNTVFFDSTAGSGKFINQQGWHGPRGSDYNLTFTR